MHQSDTASLLDLLRSRRSIRRFTDQPVPLHLIKELIETATWAPNAHNGQPWRFIVLADAETKAALVTAMGVEFRRTLLAEGLSLEEAEIQVKRSSDRMLQAPSSILLCLDTDALQRYDDPDRWEGEVAMGIQSVAMAGATFLLAAHAEGFGAAWICAPLFTQKTVQDVLDLPSSWLAQGIILLGYPKTVPAPRKRRPVEEITIFS